MELSKFPPSREAIAPVTPMTLCSYELKISQSSYMLVDMGVGRELSGVSISFKFGDVSRMANVGSINNRTIPTGVVGIGPHISSGYSLGRSGKEVIAVCMTLLLIVANKEVDGGSV